MDERLRSMRARIGGGIARLRGEHSGDATVADADVAVTDVDDDPDAEPLPPPATADADPEADEELARLDDDEAPPVEIPDDVGLIKLFADIDPIPPLPLAAPHEARLSVIVLRLADQIADTGLVEDRRVRRVLDLLGDRLAVTVSPDGITVRGLVRSRHTPWKQVQQLSFTSRYELLRGRLVTQVAEDISGRLFPMPIPGLKWLLRRIIGGISSLYERHSWDADEIEELRESLGHSLTDIERRGLDIELAGALRVLMFLSTGLSEAVKAEAAARGVKVVGVA